MNDSGPYVLIIGSANIDLNIYSNRLPKQGETVTGGTFKQFLGGKGANQAVASARSGSKTIFIGKIGKDAFGDQMVKQLIGEDIDTSHIKRDPQEPSGIAFVLIDSNGENMISVAPGANANLSIQDISENAEIIKNARCIVVQMEIPLETIQEIYNIASQGKVIKILNPAPLKILPREIFKNIDIIIPNEGELFKLHSLLNLGSLHGEKKRKIIQASANMANLGVKYVITTLGKNGSIIFDGESKEAFEVPAIKVNAVDTVGAGDCFNGVLASKLCAGESIVDAVKYATVAASIAVTRKGAQDSMPYAKEIEEIFLHYPKF